MIPLTLLNMKFSLHNFFRTKNSIKQGIVNLSDMTSQASLYRGQWLANMLDTEVMRYSRKTIVCMTLFFAFLDLTAPMEKSFVMLLLTGNADVK